MFWYHSGNDLIRCGNWLAVVWSGVVVFRQCVGKGLARFGEGFRRRFGTRLIKSWECVGNVLLMIQVEHWWRFDKSLALIGW